MSAIKIKGIILNSLMTSNLLSFERSFHFTKVIRKQSKMQKYINEFALRKLLSIST
jgi:hypothetical protein